VIAAIGRVFHVHSTCRANQRRGWALVERHHEDVGTGDATGSSANERPVITTQAESSSALGASLKVVWCGPRSLDAVAAVICYCNQVGSFASH
jgi:hypothetical protein